MADQHFKFVEEGGEEHSVELSSALKKRQSNHDANFSPGASLN